MGHGVDAAVEVLAKGMRPSLAALKIDAKGMFFFAEIDFLKQSGGPF